MSKILEIVEGWANVVKDQFNAVDPVTKSISEKRLLECNSCSIRNGNRCDPNQQIKNIITEKMVNGCGCNIAAKTLSPSSKCPAGKW